MRCIRIPVQRLFVSPRSEPAGVATGLCRTEAICLEPEVNVAVTVAERLEGARAQGSTSDQCVHGVTPCDFVMLDHAGWLKDGHVARKALPTARGLWLATSVGGSDYSLELLRGGGPPPSCSHFTLPPQSCSVKELGHALNGLGVVARFRNTCLWDAIGTAIIRQVIRAGHAKKMHRVFCEKYGERVTADGSPPMWLFPFPEKVLEITDSQYKSIGMAFKSKPLRAAAEAYLQAGDSWQVLPAPVLVDELQNIPRIGPWTASAAVADWTNDWSFYPYSDLAVRTWCKDAAPMHGWPDDEPSFAKMWRRISRDHIGELTLLTLAWGCYKESVV